MSQAVKTNTDSLGSAIGPLHGTRYVIVTPARDEEQNIEELIRSLAAQTCLPTEWIVVNDGSKDKTAEILEKYATEFPWLHVYHLRDRGHREPGGGVIRAFAYGLSHLQTKDWDFIVKLDGDLSFAPDYFDSCFEEFRKDPTLAVGGGTTWYEWAGSLRADVVPNFHVRGASKIYRRAFWDVMGGLPAVPGWDTIDELKANLLGWTTRTFPNVRILHRRPTGSADGVWRNWFKNGRANYITGYHPIFMMVKCAKRISEKPYVAGAFALFCGFASGYMRRLPQVADKELIRYVRREQVRRLLFRKSIWT